MSKGLNLTEMKLADLVALNQRLGVESDAIRVRRKGIADEIRKRVVSTQRIQN